MNDDRVEGRGDGRDTVTGLRALLVEDSGDAEGVVLAELQRRAQGVIHRRVTTPEELLRALGDGIWDVVLSDFSASFGSHAALDLLRESGLDVPFIVVMDATGEDDVVAVMRRGACDCLPKGNLARLLPAIERELREAAGRKEQRKMREQLMLSERMASVGALAAGVAHELNNPLAAIIANLELMKRDLEGVAGSNELTHQLQEIFEELADASDSARKLRHIVRDLKMFSQGAGDQTGPVDLQRTLESTLRMAWNEIRHRARLIKEYGDLPPVEANEAKLGQVFLNLIINAAHAIPEGDAANNVIRIVTTVDEGGCPVIYVKDTGAGIPDEHQGKIFEPFFTTKPEGVGTGLGLAICQRIVNDLGGDITVDSEVGKGTTFRVRFPRPRDARAEAPSAEPSVRPHRRGKVLVVDDDPKVARAVGRALKGSHEVDLASSGAEALGLVRAGARYDVIFCDLMMPQMTGMELHAELARTAPAQASAVVLLTGGAFTQAAQDFVDTTSLVCLEKPFDVQRVLALVDERVK